MYSPFIVGVAFRFTDSKAAGKLQSLGFFPEALVAVKKNKPTFCLWAETSQNASGDRAESERWQEPRRAGSQLQLGNNPGGVLGLGSHFQDGSGSELSARLSLI